MVLDEPSRAAEHARAFENEAAERQGLLLEKGRILPTEAELYASWPDILRAIRRHPSLFMASLLKRTPGVDPVRVIQVVSRTPDVYNGRLDRLAAEVREWRRDRRHICLVLSTAERGERVVEVFKDEGVEAVFVPELNGELKRGNVVVTLGQLASGGELPGSDLIFLTDNEVFGREKRRRRIRSEEPRGARLTGFNDLKIGDYVVHENHGIGRYLGVDTLKIGGVHKDYLVVQYQGEDKLYVPTEQVHLCRNILELRAILPSWQVGRHGMVAGEKTGQRLGTGNGARVVTSVCGTGGDPGTCFFHRIPCGSNSLKMPSRIRRHPTSSEPFKK